MTKINARAKGQTGEREVAAILQQVINEVYSSLTIPEASVPKIERNLMQSMKGGHDLVGLDWMAVEVKRVEAITSSGVIRKGSNGVMGWWAQCVEQAMRIGPQCEPVLFYRPNNWSWSIRMYGYVCVGPNGGARVRTPVVIELPAFLLWFKMRLKHEIGKIVTEGSSS